MARLKADGGKLMLLCRRKRLSLILVGLLSILISNPLAAQSELPAQSELAQKMIFFKNSSLALEARWERLGAFQKSVAYLKRITPFYSWINLCTAVDARDKSFLMGDCLQDEGDAVFVLPAEKFRREYSATIERLWARNELDAITFANVVLGEATNDRYLKNVVSIAQLIAVGVLAIVLFKRFNFSLIGLMSAVGWARLKRAFFISAAIWLLGGAALQMAVIGSGPSTSLLNLQTFVLVIFGGLSLVLGAILIGRWLWTRSEQY
jgi:hypothetical protein